MDALSKGADLVLGGSRASGYPTKLYYQPTILSGISNDMQVAQEETFGPIAPIQTISSDEQALEIALCSGYGLTMGIFTQDLRRGTVVINDSTNWFEYHIAFGGGAATA